MQARIIAAAAIALTGSAASAAVMTFDDVSGNYTDFDQTLGDIAGLDVSNMTLEGFGNAAVYVGNIDHWGTNYSELVDVAFAAGNGKVGELSFAPDAGRAVTITSFLVGTYYYPSGPARNVTFRIFDSAWNEIWSLTNYSIAGEADLINVNLTHNGPVHFQWGTDWDVGIDDFTYSVGPPDVSPVPLPASLPLLAAALGGLAALSRRKKG